ncbi:M20/M25/M40 family metallo-hydrolase [Shouchella sp. JSM 1781072]|uniref:M20/M25/M40 family metallo-hydrolase n=1 Tax=Shouchella sp. JSM 1781072 TaxID=3344581 RepID=UPI0035C0489D
MSYSHFQAYPHSDRVLELTKELVHQPSISGTTQENQMADLIHSILLRNPYFQKHPDNVKQIPLKGDPLNRIAIVAMLDKNALSKRATILLSHFDVVGVDDFGLYKEEAFKPVQLQQRLLQEQEGFLDEDARKDLHSNDYLFGRGSMDMKAGLAMQLSIMEDIANDEHSKENICLVAVPDEEKLSLGMFAAVEELERYQQAGWEFSACICSEPNFSAYPNDFNKYIYTGSTGKLLPFIYCLGRETHVGQPLEGINASVMAAQLAVEMEWSDTFSDQLDGESSPSPTCLRIRDLKETYDVQTPNESYLFYNVLTLHSSPEAVMEKVKQACLHASEAIYERLVNHRLAFGTDALAAAVPQPKVYTITELYERGIEKYGISFKQSYETIIEESIAENDNFTDQTLTVARNLSSYFLDLAPFYLLLLQPPYYPHVKLDETKDDAILQLTKSLQHIGTESFQESIVLKTFFPGLSDVSYLRSKGDERAETTLTTFMPLYNKNYLIPIQAIQKLNVPTINVGPFGKDAHKRTERLQLSYSTKVAPVLLRYATKHLA